MNKAIFTLASLIVTAIMSLPAHAQSVNEEFLRQAGITCGGGESIDVEGRLDVALLKKLRVASGSSEGSYNYAELQTLLSDFREAEKSTVYRNYITCLLRVVDSGGSEMPSRDIKLEAGNEPDDLVVLKRGQRMALKIGDAIAVGDLGLIFSLTHADPESLRIAFRWSNSETGKTVSSEGGTGKMVEFDNGCGLTPYKINREAQTVSFVVNCKD